MSERVNLLPGINVTSQSINDFEGARVFAKRRPGQGPDHGIEIIRVSAANFLYQDDDVNPEKKKIIGMYIMGTIEDIYSGPRIDRANRTTSPEKFRPGMEVVYNNNDYVFSVDRMNPFFNDIHGDGSTFPENIIPERVTRGYGIKRKTKSKKTKRKTKSKKPKRKTKSSKR